MFSLREERESCHTHRKMRGGKQNMTLECDCLMLNLFLDLWFCAILSSEHEMSRVLDETSEKV